MGLKAFLKRKVGPPLVVSIPRLLKDTENAVELRPKRVREWLASLDRTFPYRAGRQVQHALYCQNRIALAQANRLALTEAFAEHVPVLVKGIQNEYADQNAPLPEKMAKRAKLARRLVTELADAYKVIAVDLSLQAEDRHRDAQMSLAIHRAIEYLSEIVVHSAALYETAPTNVWRDIHRMFRYAEDKDWLSVVYPLTNQKQSNSIASLYERVILFSAADPYALTRLDASILYAWLSIPVAPPAITSRVAYAETAGRFLIDLDSDRPAIALSRATASDTDKHLRVLDGRDVIRRARHDSQEQLKTTNPTLDTRSVSDVVPLSHAVSKWDVQRDIRNAPRMGIARETTISAGISAVHFFIRQTQDGFDEEGEFVPAVESASTGGDESEVPAQVYVDLCAMSSNSGEILPISDSVEDIWEDGDGAHSMVICHTVDESETGVRLRLHNESSVRVAIDELIGMQDADDLVWSVGVVRWIRNQDEDFFDIGIHLLGVEPIPVGVLDVDQDLQLPALWLPAAKRGPVTESRADWLITPSGNVSASNPVRIRLPSGELLAGRLVSVARQGPGYDCFNLQLDA